MSCEGGEEDFVEWIVDGSFGGSWIVDFFDGLSEGLGNFFDFSLLVVFFEDVGDVFSWGFFVGSFGRRDVVCHVSSVSKKYILTHADT